MRKVSAKEKQEILQKIKQGETVKKISQIYELPISTVRTWLSTNCPELKQRFYDETNNVEARIFSMFCPYLRTEVKDREYELLQQNLQKELNEFAKKLSSKFFKEQENT